VSGRVLAFSGRTLHADNPAKYVNSPETEIYIKSRNLLGIWFAKGEIARSGKCILVEGNVDMVTLHQLGITNVVASCGTSLTVEQIRLIHKFTDNATIMYDGDSAGIHAALRGINLFLAEGLNVKVVLLPEGEDPDSYARKHTLEQMQQFIAEGERDFIEFKTDLLLEQAGSDPLKKAELINDIADTIAEIPDPVKRSVYVDSVAIRFGIESSILFQRIASDRKRKQEEALRERERETRREQDNNPGPGIDMVQTEELYLENRILAPAEEDLLYYLLTYGCEELEFESDSPYYSGSEEDKPTVADFIRESLEADGSAFANTHYKALYDRYIALYDKGLSQENILKEIINGSDRVLADLATRFSTRRYQLTVGAFEASLTSTSTVLSAGVPKAILVYAERRVHDKLENLRRKLPGLDADAQMEVMKEMLRLQAAQRRINQRIGRDKKE
jgi:DNA primase